VLELKELAGAVGCLAERDDPGVPDDSLERLQVGKPVAGLDRLQPNRSRSHPFRDCRFLSRLRREGNDGDDDEKADESSAHNSDPGRLASRILHRHVIDCSPLLLSSRLFQKALSGFSVPHCLGVS
jgi:hypothetical protein